MSRRESSTAQVSSSNRIVSKLNLPPWKIENLMAMADLVTSSTEKATSKGTLL
jgi:hypothetical protein